MQSINQLENSKEKKFITTTTSKSKDFFLGDFYLKLELANNNELYIVNYNTKKLDGIKFFLKLTIDILQKASDLFKKFDKIEKIYDIIIKIIEEKKYKLYHSSSKVIFSIMPNNIINNTKEILFYLNKISNEPNNDFFKVLSDEINKLKKIIYKLINPEEININNLTEIKKLKEENIQIKKEINKLKQLIIDNGINNNNSNNISTNGDSYKTLNSKYSIKSDSKINTQTRKIAIFEFNKEYNTNIKDAEIKELNLRMKKLGNGVLKYLSRLELNQLEILDLSDNSISDITLLKNSSFPNLQSLSLDGNNITDLSPLCEVNFPCLQGLFSFNNKINDISFLEKVNFPELQSLYLYNNKINDIKALKNTNFPLMESLNLYGNNISDINVLEKVNYPKLQFLSLHSNEIKDISVFEKVKFDDLEELYLYSNKITDISVFEKVKFNKLQKLDLHNNKISDISVLDKINCNKISELYLNNNLIKNISVFEKVKFIQLQKLSLHYNKISDITVFEKIKLNKLQELYLDGNNIDINKFKNIIMKLKTCIKDFCV